MNVRFESDFLTQTPFVSIYLHRMMSFFAEHIFYMDFGSYTVNSGRAEE